MMDGNGIPPHRSLPSESPCRWSTGCKKSPARLCNCRLLRSLCPRGRHQEIDRGARQIVSVDTSAAEALSGVHAVITGSETKGHGVLPISRTELIAHDKVRYKGEPVAAVAADTIELAIKACNLIVVEYEELPAYYTAEDALAKDAVDHMITAKAISNAMLSSRSAMSIVALRTPIWFTRPNTIAPVRQVQTEPHAAYVEYDGERDELTVRASTQVPYYVHLMLSKILKMPKSKIRVIKPYVGGGFGCRTEALNVEMITAMLARRAKATVHSR